MDVAIAGGHGKVARHLTAMLAARGDDVRGIIRDAAQADDIREEGGEPVVLDLEEATTSSLAEVVRGANAVVFAAGAGPGSGAARKETVDYGAAAKLVAAAAEARVDRYVMISAMGAADPPDDDSVFSAYLRAKARADAELMASDLSWTIVRPGRLTNDPGTGLVTIAEKVPRGEIPREDVAAVLMGCLDEEHTVGQVFEVVAGDTAIREAINGLVG